MNDDDVFEIRRKDLRALLRLKQSILSAKKLPLWEKERKEELGIILDEMGQRVDDLQSSAKERGADTAKHSYTEQLNRDTSTITQHPSTPNLLDEKKKEGFEEGRRLAEREFKQILKKAKDEAFADGYRNAELDIKQKVNLLPEYETWKRNAYKAEIEFVEEDFEDRIKAMKSGEQIAYARARVSMTRSSFADKQRHSIACKYQKKDEVVLFSRPIDTVEIKDARIEGRFVTMYEYCLRKL